MKEGMTPRRASLRNAWLRALGILVISMILLRFGADVLLQATYSRETERSDVASYRERVKTRIRDEVRAAVTVAEYVWADGRGSLSETELKAKVAELLGSLQSSDVGYVFAADYSGISTIGPNVGADMYYVRDKNGLYVVRELIAAARAGGGYVEYVMPPIEGYAEVPKISYVLPFEPFGWYIGAGVTLDEIGAIEKRIAREDRGRFWSLFARNGISAFLLIFALVLINRVMYSRINRELTAIEGYLARSSLEECDSMPGSYRISELANIADHSGRLVHQLFSSMKELERAKRRFETMVRSMPDLVFIVDRAGRFLDYSTPDEERLLVPPRVFLGRNLGEILPADVSGSAMDRLDEAFARGEPTVHEYSMYPGGVKKWYEARFIPMDEAQALILVRETTELTETRIKNEYLSYHDQLTGLFNRRFFEEELHRLDTERNLPLAVIMIDVNGLKMINDAFGHEKGDELLVAVSELLRTSCREGEVISRVGGDEFVILLPSTSEKSAEKLIRRIYDRLAEQPAGDWVISISAGLSVKETPRQPVELTYATAEKNMYRRKLAESQSMRNQTVQIIMRTLGEKNRRERVHSDRVGNLCRRIGEAMGLEYQTVKELETAGLLHDIGKIVVDDKLVNKAGPLTPEEYAEVKKHPEISYQILRAVDSYATIADDILSHHERWDGAGYPRGLAGENISLAGRIIAVADSYEAMTATRPYRMALPHETALEEIRRNSGTQFDPSVVEIFLKMDFGDTV